MQLWISSSSLASPTRRSTSTRPSVPSNFMSTTSTPTLRRLLYSVNWRFLPISGPWVPRLWVSFHFWSACHAIASLHLSIAFLTNPNAIGVDSLCFLTSFVNFSYILNVGCRDILLKAPIVFPHMVAAMDAFFQPPKQIIIAGDPKSESVRCGILIFFILFYQALG